MHFRFAFPFCIRVLIGRRILREGEDKQHERKMEKMLMDIEKEESP